MTSYFSILFFAVFLPLVVAAYGIAPRKARWVVLLVASYAFFWILSGRLIVFILASTVSVYGLALALDAQVRQRDERLANATSGCAPSSRRVSFSTWACSSRSST